MLTILMNIRSSPFICLHYSKHITEECETCKGNAFICELCTDKQVLILEIRTRLTVLHLIA